jgi:hypothetical protein
MIQRGALRGGWPVTEAQARANAAPLSTAIFGLGPSRAHGVAAAAEARRQAIGIEADHRPAATHVRLDPSEAIELSYTTRAARAMELCLHRSRWFLPPTAA